MSYQIIQSGFRFLSTLFISALFLASITCTAQAGSFPNKKQIVDITDSISVNPTMLERKFGRNKSIPTKYQNQIIYTLSYFPELIQTKIKFKIKKSVSGIISTRPTIGGLLRRSSKRKYIVVIYDSTEGRTLPAFSNGGVNGQVGILGHELCHIVYFNSKSGLGLLGLGIAHISRRYMDRFEYKTDSMNIVRGLGYQLMSWKQYLDKGFAAMRGHDTALPEKIITRQRYMSVEQIRNVIEKTR